MYRLAMPVLAGPVEATALGNVLVQGRALGALSGSLEDLRSLIARTHEPVVHQPTAEEPTCEAASAEAS